jgi:hypothetical protein
MTERSEVIIGLSRLGHGASSPPDHNAGPHGPDGPGRSEEAA